MGRGRIVTRVGATITTHRVEWKEKDPETGRWRTKHSPTYDTVDEAQCFLDILHGNRAQGLHSPLMRYTTVERLANRWYEGRPVAPETKQTRDREHSHIRARIVPYWGHWRADDVGRADVQKWINLLSTLPDPDADEDEEIPRHLTYLKPRTVRSVFGTFRSILIDAALDGFLPRGNPATTKANRIRLPSNGLDPRRFLTPVELRHLLQVTRTQFPAQFPMVWVAANTGMRIGEIVALERADYSSVGSRLIVSRALKGRVIGAPKNEQTRAIDLDPTTMEIIEATLRAHDSKYIFPGRHEWMHPMTFRDRHWSRIRKAAGFPDLRFHDLRHTHISILLSAGRPAIEVADRAGHSIEMTQKNYGHFIHSVANQSNRLTDAWRKATA